MTSRSSSTRDRGSDDLLDRSYWNGTIRTSLSKFFVLRVLHDRPMHGYEINREVRRVTCGCCSPAEGTLYPLLRQLEEGGYLTSRVESVGRRERRVYTLTARGRRAFATAVDAWQEALGALQAARALVTADAAPPAAKPGR